MKIVVIGGSGLIGKKLIPLLRGRGHEAVSASPSSGVNTITGEGLGPALAGADVVEIKGDPKTEISGLAHDSRAAGPGTLFFAIPGALCVPCRQLYVDQQLIGILGLEGARCTFAIESDRVLQTGPAGQAPAA